MAEVNLKNVQCSLSNEVLVQKGANLSKKERQGNDVAHPLLPNLFLHLDEERRKVRSQVKRSEGGDLLVRLCLHCLVIPRALRVRKKSKKPRGSILYRMKIKWELPSELASYAKTQFQKYIPEKSINDAICEVHLVPNNLSQVKKMDEFLRDLLKEKTKNNSLAVDEILGKIQKRTLSVMGPLSKVWLKLENAKKSDAPPLSLDEILSLLEQTICLLGQTSNSFSYHRRYNILSSVCSPQEAKNMLKNKAELLKN